MRRPRPRQVFRLIRRLWFRPRPVLKHRLRRVLQPIHRLPVRRHISPLLLVRPASRPVLRHLVHRRVLNLVLRRLVLRRPIRQVPHRLIRRAHRPSRPHPVRRVCRLNRLCRYPQLRWLRRRHQSRRHLVRRYRPRHRSLRPRPNRQGPLESVVWRIFSPDSAIRP